MTQRRAPRIHFGQGELSLNPSTSVYINCPFDAEYRPLFYAIVFASVCCGFMPRSALETGTVSEPRMERIIKAMFGSKYSIHDLSRCQGEGDENLARFNMPLELGIAMAMRFIGTPVPHDWLVLIPEGHPYLKYISDLGAYDLSAHDNSERNVVVKTVAWLSTRQPDAVLKVTPEKVLALLPKFKKAKAELDSAWHGSPPWSDTVMAAMNAAKALRSQMNR